MDEKDLFLIGKEACIGAGKLLRERYILDAKVENSEGKDIKTEADRAAEEVIFSALQKTGIVILSEEFGESSDFNDKALYWVVDPLDGTFNFVKGFPLFCVSIALWRKQEPVMGFIYDIHHDNLYAGKVGEGAWLNDSPMVVSKTENIGSAVLSTGFPNKRSYSLESIHTSIKQIQQFKKIRMIGSAAMSLAFVCSGVFDAYFEESIWFWDVAAGLAIIKSAGGKYTITNKNENWQMDVFASNGALNR